MQAIKFPIEKIAKAKPAPSSAPALIGRQDGITVSLETRMVGMRTGSPTQCLHKPLAVIIKYLLKENNLVILRNE